MTKALKKIIEKKDLFYLMAIAVMVAIIGISCSASPTESASLSESGTVIETPITPPTTGGGQTPTEPALKITDWGAIQFDGKTFKNENHTVNIVVKNLGGNMSEARFELNGKTYGFGSRIYNSQYNPNTFIFGNINGNINDRGYAEFRESGDLLIWFNNNQSDLITLKLTQKDETPSIPEVKPEETPTGPVLPIKKWGVASQFIGLTFRNETLTATIEGRAIENQLYSRVFAVITGGDKGEEYEIHFPKGDSLYAVTHNGRNGSALFSESGSLKIWFNNNQSDLITLQLVK